MKVMVQIHPNGYFKAVTRQVMYLKFNYKPCKAGCVLSLLSYKFCAIERRPIYIIAIWTDLYHHLLKCSPASEDSQKNN